ncbi:MAG TPA: hypothetical protein G4O15_06255 [Dehalococcoidia bacterium]|nr:hypothetical protein [Dehalococcoidia bacterium]
MSKGSAKTVAWLGVFVGWISNFIGGEFGIALALIGAAAAVVGCIFWAQAKKRHWAHGFWGLLAPIGFIGVGALEDRS